MQITEGAASTSAAAIPRGQFPGLYYVPLAGTGASFPRGSRMAHEGRVLVSVRQGASFTENANISGLCWVDVTGPWRA